jgi:hypothetical protein
MKCEKPIATSVIARVGKRISFVISGQVSTRALDTASGMAGRFKDIVHKWDSTLPPMPYDGRFLDSQGGLR